MELADREKRKETEQSYIEELRLVEEYRHKMYKNKVHAYINIVFFLIILVCVIYCIWA